MPLVVPFSFTLAYLIYSIIDQGAQDFIPPAQTREDRYLSTFSHLNATAGPPFPTNHTPSVKPAMGTHQRPALCTEGNEK